LGKFGLLGGLFLIGFGLYFRRLIIGLGEYFFDDLFSIHIVYLCVLCLIA
jgi:hypothetical protein